MPGVLRRPGGSLWVWANTVCGGMSVRRWLCPERPRLCALQRVRMHLPRPLLSGEPFDACQILQVKDYDVKGIAQDIALAEHVSLYPSTRSWRRHLWQRIAHRAVNVLPLVRCVKQRAVERTRSALCTTPNATVIDVSCFTLYITQHILTQNVFDKYIMHSFQSFPSLGMIQNWISYSKVNYIYGSPFLPWDKYNLYIHNSDKNKKKIVIVRYKLKILTFLRILSLYLAIFTFSFWILSLHLTILFLFHWVHVFSVLLTICSDFWEKKTALWDINSAWQLSYITDVSDEW